MYVKNLLSILLVTALPVTAFANDDAVKNKGVEITADQLRNKDSRKALINHDEKSKDADKAAMSTVGEKNTDEMYNISADILPILFKDKTPEQVVALLQEAQNDPKKFYESLPADTKKKIHELASKVESKGPTNKKSP